MATVYYPDITGEYVALPERYETAGLQYVGYFEPAQIAPEQAANLFLFLQNTLDVPLEVGVAVTIPRMGSGLFSSGKEVLKIERPVFQLQLTEIEAGLLTLPVTTIPDAPPGEYPLTIEFKVVSKSRGNRVRPAQAQSQLGEKSLIDNVVGLNLTSSLGATFVEKSVKKATFGLKVAGKPQPPDRPPKLKHSYQTVWTREAVGMFNQAIHELNERQVKLHQELGVEALYVTLYSESTGRFADAGLPLRVGEAIMLAKILTYTCQYFLNSSERRNGLLAPMWERAFAGKMDTTDALQVIRSPGYYHLLKLAVALSFGLVAQAVGRQVWSLEERQAVNSHIADSIETGQTLDVEFLYLPLLMAGTYISSKVVMQGEDARHSMALMKKAYEERSDLFLDDDMAQASKVYSFILKKAIQ